MAVRFTHNIQNLPQCGWDNIPSGTFRCIHQFQKPKMAVNKCQANSVRAIYKKKSYELDSMHRMAEGY